MRGSWPSVQAFGPAFDILPTSPFDKLRTRFEGLTLMLSLSKYEGHATRSFVFHAKAHTRLGSKSGFWPLP